MAVKEVDDALEEVVKPDGCEDESERQQHRAEIVGGHGVVMAGQEIEEECAEGEHLQLHESTKEEVALDGTIEKVVALLDGKEILGHLPKQEGMGMEDGGKKRYFNEQDDGDDVIQIGSVGQTEADVSLKKPVVHCAFFSVGDSYIRCTLCIGGANVERVWKVARLYGSVRRLCGDRRSFAPITRRWIFGKIRITGNKCA